LEGGTERKSFRLGFILQTGSVQLFENLMKALEIQQSEDDLASATEWFFWYLLI